MKQSNPEDSMPEKCAMLLAVIADMLAENGVTNAYLWAAGNGDYVTDLSIRQAGKRLKQVAAKMVTAFESNPKFGDEMLEFGVDREFFRILIQVGRGETQEKDGLRAILDHPNLRRLIQEPTEKANYKGPATVKILSTPFSNKTVSTIACIHSLFGGYAEQARELEQTYDAVGFKTYMTDEMEIGEEGFEFIQSFPPGQRSIVLTMALAIIGSSRPR